MDLPIPNQETLQNELEIKDIEKQQKCSSVDSLIEMLEDDCKDSNEVLMNIEEQCSPKLIQPADIKQEALMPTDLENIDEEDDLDDSAILDEEDSDYEGLDDKNDVGEEEEEEESNSPKKSKMVKNSLKKKTPEILIPQMASLNEHIFYGNT